jgi:hypothetical protein
MRRVALPSTFINQIAGGALVFACRNAIQVKQHIVALLIVVCHAREQLVRELVNPLDIDEISGTLTSRSVCAVHWTHPWNLEPASR